MGKALLELARMEGGVLGNALEGDSEDPQVESAAKMTEDEQEEVGAKVMEALEENFVEHEEKVACLLDGHKKAVDTEEIEEGLESMDVDEKNAAKKSEDMEAEVENEDLSNLQRAWEVLELAKVIYTRMIKEGKNAELNEKKFCETLLTLGEVSI